MNGQKRVVVAVEVMATSEREAFSTVEAVLKTASLGDAPELGQVFVRAAVAADNAVYPLLRRQVELT